MRKNKSKLCVLIPTVIYNKLNHDYEVYGIAKSYIVSTALMEYYQKRSETAPPVKGA